MTDDLATAVMWRKSTRSNTNGACVEIAGVPAGVAVRDSKDPGGTVLAVRGPAWAAFTAGIRCGEFC